MKIKSKNHIGFIGAGNMGAALIKGLSCGFPAENIHVFDIDKNKTEELRKQTGIQIHSACPSLLKKCNVLIIAVKPDAVGALLKTIKNGISGKLLISIAAGIKISSIENITGAGHKIIRAMPNTPALIEMGMTVISANKNAGPGDIKTAEQIFSAAGKVLSLPEKMMDGVTGLSGSGPAYVFTFIQALRDAGVKMGIPGREALLLAAQTVAGAAAMVLETGSDPISLRGQVTSPGGTTIEGVHVLEKSGFSGIIIDAVEAAALKSKNLG